MISDLLLKHCYCTTPSDSKDDKKSDVKEERSELLNQLNEIVDENVEIVLYESKNFLIRDKFQTTLDKTGEV